MRNLKRLERLERNRPRPNVIRVVDVRGLTDEEAEKEKERIRQESGDHTTLIVLIDM